MKKEFKIGDIVKTNDNVWSVLVSKFEPHKNLNTGHIFKIVYFAHTNIVTKELGFRTHDVYIEDQETKEIFLHSKRFLTYLIPEVYPVVTPISGRGDILFNDGKSVLGYNNDGLQIHTSSISYEENRYKFIWEKIDRKELRCGDTAYRKNKDDLDFSVEKNVCKIVDEDFYYCIQIDCILKRVGIFSHWYKLVKNEL